MAVGVIVIHHNCLMIIKEEDKVIGTFLGSYQTSDEFLKYDRGHRLHENPEFVVKKYDAQGWLLLDS